MHLLFLQKNSAKSLKITWFNKNNYGSKISTSHTIQPQIQETPDEQIESFEKGIGFLGQSDMNVKGSKTKSSKIGNNGSQELTVSYLCWNNKSKLGFLDKDIRERNLMTVDGLREIFYSWLRAMMRHDLDRTL